MAEHESLQYANVKCNYDTEIVAAVPVKAAVSVPRAVTADTAVPFVGSVPGLKVAVSPDTVQEGKDPTVAIGVIGVVISVPLVMATEPAGV